VPGTPEMENLLRTAAAVLPIENLWVNPDCGLKTRGWDEVIASLRNMTKVAEALRKDRSVLSGVSAQPEAKS
jgi:5-methyltetrahydropteroyltriglutamate--homocysteine methyltransferase